MTNFKAFRIDRQDNTIAGDFQSITLDDLTKGDVVIKVNWSGINYKDALAGTGKGQILRQFPLNGGIDLAGEVVSSQDLRYQEGDSVLVCGCGLSETADGGYSELARVCGDCVVPLPEGMSERDAMGIGTAGFTAALAIMRLEQMDQTPDMGPIVVTGATGGVGSFAINMLSSRGYDVTAFTGKTDHYDYLRSLGANDFIDRNALEMSGRPLDKALWGGAVDAVGGDTLAWLASTVKPFGNIACIGLAGSYKLVTTVMPLILRGVSLIGINSIEMPTAMRTRAWQRLADDLKPRDLDKIVTREIEFDALPTAFDDYLTASVLGRTVVKIS